MPRKQKPPGYENWTWEEIRLGHRLSKGEKRARRLAKNLGATEDENGKIVPPKGEEAFLYYLVIIGAVILMLALAIMAEMGK